MNLMAGGASFARGLMLEDKRASLSGMALRASFILRSQGSSAPLHGRSFVRIVAVGTTHFSFQNRMMRREIELASFINMALEACLGRFTRIDDRVMSSTRFMVNAARSMAGFTTQVDGVFAFGFEKRMRRGLEVLGDVLVALRAVIRSDEMRSGNLRRGHYDPGNTDTGNEDGRSEHAAEGYKCLCAGDAEKSGVLR